MLDIIPCTNCEANEVRAELDAIEALCEPCQDGGWHRFNHTECYHTWYHEPVPNSQRAEDLQYKLERQWLKSLPAETTVSCLNGFPTSAEERIHTIEQILGDWYGIFFEEARA